MRLLDDLKQQLLVANLNLKIADMKGNLNDKIEAIQVVKDLRSKLGKAYSQHGKDRRNVKETDGRRCTGHSDAVQRSTGGD